MMGTYDCILCCPDKLFRSSEFRGDVWLPLRIV
jgi:hypothetical protein